MASTTTTRPPCLAANQTVYEHPFHLGPKFAPFIPAVPAADEAAPQPAGAAESTPMIGMPGSRFQNSAQTQQAVHDAKRSLEHCQAGRQLARPGSAAALAASAALRFDSRQTGMAEVKGQDAARMFDAATVKGKGSVFVPYRAPKSLKDMPSCRLGPFNCCNRVTVGLGAMLTSLGPSVSSDSDSTQQSQACSSGSGSGTCVQNHTARLSSQAAILGSELTPLRIGNSRACSGVAANAVNVANAATAVSLKHVGPSLAPAGGARSQKSGDQKHSSSPFTLPRGQLDVGPQLPLLAGRFRFVEALSEGGSAKVFKAQDTLHPDRRLVVIKAMHRHYREVGVQEQQLLRFLNSLDKDGSCHVVKILSGFDFHGHSCLVLEHMQGSLLDYMCHLERKAKKEAAAATTNTINSSNGQSQSATRAPLACDPARLSEIRTVAFHLLTALATLQVAGVIHGDLKPENILLQLNTDKSGSGAADAAALPASKESLLDRGLVGVKLADFGNSFIPEQIRSLCRDFNVQTLAYRAPEVLLGVPFDRSIDMWSLGCIIAELAMGRLLFACESPAQLLQQMVGMLGAKPPAELFGKGKNFERLHREARIPCGEEATLKTSSAASPSGDQKQLASSASPGGARSSRSIPRRGVLNSILQKVDPGLADFIRCLLQYDPSMRPSPRQALMHPFLNPIFPFKLLFPLNPSTPPHHREKAVLRDPSSASKKLPSTLSALLPAVSGIAAPSAAAAAAAVAPGTVVTAAAAGALRLPSHSASLNSSICTPSTPAAAAAPSFSAQPSLVFSSPAGQQPLAAAATTSAPAPLLTAPNPTRNPISPLLMTQWPQQQPEHRQQLQHQTHAQEASCHAAYTTPPKAAVASFTAAIPYIPLSPLAINQIAAPPSALSPTSSIPAPTLPFSPNSVLPSASPCPATPRTPCADLPANQSQLGGAQPCPTSSQEPRMLLRVPSPAERSGLFLTPRNSCFNGDSSSSSDRSFQTPPAAAAADLAPALKPPTRGPPMRDMSGKRALNFSGFSMNSPGSTLVLPPAQQLPPPASAAGEALADNCVVTPGISEPGGWTTSGISILEGGANSSPCSIRPVVGQNLYQPSQKQRFAPFLSQISSAGKPAANESTQFCQVSNGGLAAGSGLSNATGSMQPLMVRCDSVNSRPGGPSGSAPAATGEPVQLPLMLADKLVKQAPAQQLSALSSLAQNSVFSQAASFIQGLASAVTGMTPGSANQDKQHQFAGMVQKPTSAAAPEAPTQLHVTPPQFQVIPGQFRATSLQLPTDSFQLDMQRSNSANSQSTPVHSGAVSAGGLPAAAPGTPIRSWEPAAADGGSAGSGTSSQSFQNSKSCSGSEQSLVGGEGCEGASSSWNGFACGGNENMKRRNGNALDFDAIVVDSTHQSPTKRARRSEQVSAFGCEKASLVNPSSILGGIGQFQAGKVDFEGGSNRRGAFEAYGCHTKKT